MTVLRVPGILPASHVKDEEAHLGNTSGHSRSPVEARMLEPEHQDKGRAAHPGQVLSEKAEHPACDEDPCPSVRRAPPGVGVSVRGGLRRSWDFHHHPAVTRQPPLKKKKKSLKMKYLDVSLTKHVQDSYAEN